MNGSANIFLIFFIALFAIFMSGLFLGRLFTSFYIIYALFDLIVVDG